MLIILPNLVVLGQTVRALLRRLPEKLTHCVPPFKVTQGHRIDPPDDFLLKLTATMGLSRTVYEINGDFSRKLIFFVHLTPPLEKVPPSNWDHRIATPQLPRLSLYLSFILSSAIWTHVHTHSVLMVIFPGEPGSAGSPLILLHLFLNCASFWDRPKLSTSFLTQSHQVFFGRHLQPSSHTTFDPVIIIFSFNMCKPSQDSTYSFSSSN